MGPHEPAEKLSPPPAEDPPEAMSGPSDLELVQAILSGNTALFADVVRRYDRRVRHVVERGVRDPDSREELVQRTFYQAFRKLPALADPRKLEAWLLRIARNGVAEFHRQQRTRPQPLTDRGALDGSMPPTTSSWVWEEVRRLSPCSRDALELRYRQGSSYAEIARRLNVPLSTVRGRIYQARRELRKRLADLEG
jgi:RNA polymerase sigma-70 factor (ECF subfamily)